MLPTSASTGPLTNRRWTARTLIMPPYIRRTGACLIHIKDDEKRKVASDASVSWIGSRHSVSWHNAGKAARIRDHRPPDEIRCSPACVVVHVPAPRRQQIVILSHHHSSSALITQEVIFAIASSLPSADPTELFTSLRQFWSLALVDSVAQPT